MVFSPQKHNVFFLGANALLLIIFLFSVFWNISCPLLWNDEAHTVMNAKFTAQFGYPKVTDGKNVVYAYQVNPDGSFGRFDEKLQASNLPIWAGYYWGIPPFLLAKMVQDIYIKTLVFRVWFAVTGVLGLFFIIKSAIGFVELRRHRVFIVLFLLLCILNISLGLHVREVRYYSLMLLLSGISLFLFTKLYFDIAERKWILRTGLSLALALMFFTFHPLYFIFLAFFSLWLLPGGIKRLFIKTKNQFINTVVREVKHFSPLVISFILVLPFFGFFKPFAESGLHVPMRKNLLEVIGYLAKYDFLLAAVVLKICFAGFMLFGALKKDLYNIIDYRKITGNLFFSLGFFVYMVVIARIPENTHLFTRYYLLLFPLIYCSLILDAFLIRDWWKRLNLQRFWPAAVLAIGVTLYFSHLPLKWRMIKERAFELTHCYKGPLDYVIPFISEKFDGKTNGLVIATNYEEPAFMYYLDAKTTIGFLGNNLKQDTTITPDVIVYRKHWTRFEDIFKGFLSRNDYERFTFPVKDIPVNNLPQLDYRISHYFRTPLAESEGDQLDIFILKEQKSGE